MQAGDVGTVAPTGPTRVLHVITDLRVAGAQVSLCRLLTRLDRAEFEAAVVSLKVRGVMAERITSLGIPVYSLRLGYRASSALGLRQFHRVAASWRPDLLQGWMYHGNLAASIVAGLMKRSPPVVWNVRHSINRLDEECRPTRWIIKGGALMSRYAKKIIYNSHVSAHQHERLGYSQGRTVVIPNGFDTADFGPSEERRRHMRSTSGISADQFVVGMLARYHPMKDHANFIQAAKRILATHPNAVFLLAGRDVTLENVALRERITTSGLTTSVRLLGEIADVPSFMAALDVLASASAYGEGFPNVVGEAMAVGVPCVVTDVGDSAMLVGDQGSVVPPRDPSALATAIGTLIDLGTDARGKIGLEARDRIVKNFSLADVSGRYAALYGEVLES